MRWGGAKGGEDCCYEEQHSSLLGTALIATGIDVHHQKDKPEKR